MISKKEIVKELLKDDTLPKKELGKLLEKAGENDARFKAAVDYQKSVEKVEKKADKKEAEKQDGKKSAKK